MKTQKPETIDVYALGIIKIGHDTRELSVGGTGSNPLTNETMLFQKLHGELFTDYIGLFQFPVNPGEHPGAAFANAVRDLFEIRIERKLEYKCIVSELMYCPDRTIHNFHYVFSQRFAHIPRINDEEITTEQILQSQLYTQRNNFHPTHYEILKQFILTNRRLNDTKPKMLEIELQQYESGPEKHKQKYMKLLSAVST